MEFLVHWDCIQVPLGIGPDMSDITGRLEDVLRASKVINGSLQASVVGSTGSLTTIEYEPGVVEDLKRAIERLAPRDMEYLHEQAWHDGNGHSHVQAALLGPSLIVPVREGGLRLGTWQQAVLINHDNKPRTRPVEVTVMGLG
ncbi:MAG: secondary thiamine-phosphate synthase enzyme YjbQ [Thermodesulfobacteriota bacterium]|nr:secondary thiamine-phosphate synthase enzyme YjbQ [Thermodesulfobacteriota bacterium]